MAGGTCCGAVANPVIVVGINKAREACALFVVVESGVGGLNLDATLVFIGHVVCRNNLSRY